MTARLRSQLTPGPAAVPPSCQLARLLALEHRRARLPASCFLLRASCFVHPRHCTGLPPRPHAQVPPSCQLARLLRQRRPLTGSGQGVGGRPVDRSHSVGFNQVPFDAQLVALPSRSSHQGGPWCIGAIPLYRPGAAGFANGGVFTNRAKDRADAQRLVATRLLDRLHDPLGHISRLQRIHPRAR